MFSSYSCGLMVRESDLKVVGSILNTGRTSNRMQMDSHCSHCSCVCTTHCS